MGLKYLALLLLIPQIAFGYTPGQSVISVGDNKRGNRSQLYVPPPASGLEPTAQYTYAADHAPTTDMWRQTTADYYISATGASGAAGTIGDPFDFQEFLDGTVSITQNVGAPTVVAMRAGTYIYPNRGNGHGGFEYDISGQTPAADWAKSTSYSIGDQVREDNQNPDSGHRDLSTLESFSPHFWECTTAHTSGTGTLQDDVANWKYVHIPDHYILVRNYNGEQVYIDGGLEAVGLDIDSGPQYIAFWGLNHYSQEFVDDWDSDGNDDTSVNVAGDRFLAYEGNASFPSNIPHDGSVSTTYGRGFRMINNVSWAINFGSGGTQAEEQWWHGNISYDSGWVTTLRHHGPFYYQRNGEVTNTIAAATGDPMEMWLDTNMMLESYSQQLQIYGTSGVALEMFVIQRNFAMKHPNSGRENFLGGGNRNFAATTNTWQIFGNEATPFSETFPIMTPNDVQGETDDVKLMKFAAERYPNGVTITSIHIDASAAYTSETFLFEHWDDASGTTQATVESITASSISTEDDGTLTDATIPADYHLVVNLDDTPEDISQVLITITGTFVE